jgi:hypothetical protein
MKSIISFFTKYNLPWLKIQIVLPFIILISCHNSVLFSFPFNPGPTDTTLRKAGFANLKTLETVNSFNGHWCCANDGYLYGTGTQLRTVLRKTENGQSVEARGSVTSLDPSFTIDYKMFSTSRPGLIFILVKNNSGYFLLKSSDGAATFKNVFAFGQGNGPGGTNNSDVRVLRGILELTTNTPDGRGVGTLYLGEYNVSRLRTAGGVDDRIRIMKSVDYGDTWTKVVEWNTNGVNEIGHIHAMEQDPYTGEIYICTGDGINKAGIIKWDGSSAWADNKTLAELGTMKGFSVLTGKQRYRVCDVLFDEKYFYVCTDTQTPNNPTGSESGIWRGTKDFASYVRVDNKIYDYDPMHIGWFGEKIGNTFIFTTSREYVDSSYAWKELNTRIYSSNDGENWYASGVINWRDLGDPTIARYIYSVFSYNNRLYIDCVGGAGHSSTIQCELTKEWKTFEDPVILHPVFFVGKWNAAGNDANPGTNPDAPKLTLSNTLTSNRISAGSRIRVSEGSFSETNINPLWSGTGIMFLQGRGSVVIEGSGMDKTHIIRSSGTGNAYAISLESSRTLTNANTPLILKDLDIYITVDGGLNHSNYVLQNIDSYIKTIRCRIGNSANDDSPLVNLNSPGAKYVSENSIYVANSASSIYKNIIRAGATNPVYHLQNCIILNGYDAFDNNFPGIDLELENCTLYGIEHDGLITGSTFNTQPFIKNCIFSCGEAPLKDLAGLTETAIDYNLYNKANINVTDCGHNLQIGTDPMFLDAANRNFELKSNSPCAMIGISLPDVSYDFLNRERPNPPSLGAYESPALTVTPSDITISSASGSKGNFNVKSNTSWNISHTDNWLNLSSLSGNGIGAITVTATSPNDSSGSRIASVIFSGTSVSPVTVRVTQSFKNSTIINNVTKMPVNIYPNPVSGFLNINYRDDRFKSFYILNSQGVILSKEKVKVPIQLIDFSKYRDGLYILEFFNSDGESTMVKVVK